MNIKKCLALLLALVLMMSSTVSLAEVYTIESIGAELELPVGMAVTDYEETDEAITLTLSYEDRTDCQFRTVITFNEAYAEYWIPTMPQEMIDELLAHYDSLYEGEYPADCDTEVGMISSTGTAADGYVYSTYVYIYGGFVFETTGGLASDKWDPESFQATFDLAWQVMIMVDNMIA